MQENGKDVVDKDINDIFDDILLSEEKVIEESYKEGFQIGIAKGNPEGYHLGYHRGAELGAEIGYYVGVTESYLQYLKNSNISEKLFKSLETLKVLLDNFPRHNAEDVDIIEQATNFHMVDYFSKEAYTKYIPENIQYEIKEIGEEEITNYIFTDDYRKLPNLLKFVEKSREFTLKNCPDVCLNINDFQGRLIEWGCEEFLRLKLEIFMTSKKSHEVDILSFISAAVRNIAGTSHIIDIGDGKGYLSSMLALHYKIPVLGVDASVFVHEGIDFNELVTNIFLKKPNGLSLVGLHTCGNLAASSIRIFNSNEHIKTICNVGCCYHLMTECYEEDPNKKENILLGHGFPMSSYLKRKEFVIGRAARMIAAQSVDRIMDKKNLPNKTIFYRALFEVLLERRCENVPSNQRYV
ncbi:hypothetical protein NQ314_019056, partial [Rhamnusium bicolor]